MWSHRSSKVETQILKLLNALRMFSIPYPIQLCLSRHFYYCVVFSIFLHLDIPTNFVCLLMSCKISHIYYFFFVFNLLLSFPSPLWRLCTSFSLNLVWFVPDSWSVFSIHIIWSNWVLFGDKGHFFRKWIS